MKALIIISILGFIIILIILSLTFFNNRIKAIFYIDHMEREERLERMYIDSIIEKLAVKPGQKIADIGAGSGLFSRKIAMKIAPHGIVYAIDINKHLLDHINKTNKKEGITNIITVLAKETDPQIPELVDLIYICDTLHYIDEQEKYIKTMSSYLKNGGKIAVVDFKINWPPLSIKFTKDDLINWMNTAGLTLIEDYDFIEDEFLMIFKTGNSGI